MNCGSFFHRKPAAAFCLAASVAFLPSFSPIGFAQTQPQAGADRLAAIQVTGSVRFRSELIVAAMGLHAGAQVTNDDLQNAANNLAQLGPFASVHYRYATTDAGVRAEYQVTDAPAVAIWYDNFPWFTDDELNAALKDSVPLFDGMAPPGGTLLDALSDAIEKQLATRGVHANVSHVLTIAPGTDERIQQFRVEDAGATIASVEFTDAVAQGDRAIQSRLTDLVGEKFSRTAIGLFEFEQVRPVYLAHAFLHVRFGPPAARFVAGSGDSRIAIVAPIETGPAYEWNGVTWKGNSALGVLELETLFPLHGGDFADGTKIENGWQAVRDAYARRGYLNADLVATPQFDDAAKRVAYTASITEGPQYHMGKLVLTGLSIEGERRIRAAWKIAPGDVFDKSVYDEFASNGIKGAFMGLPVHYEKIGRFLQENPASATVDVLFDFQ